MKGEILINYEQVYSTVAEMRSYIQSDILTRAASDYEQIQSMLEQVDGATNARLKENMEEQKMKSIMVANTLDKLLSFMTNTAKEFEQIEEEMAQEIASGAVEGRGEE